MTARVHTNRDMETFTGLYFDFENPREAHVDVLDVAHALSNTCRFGGHVTTFYSVAEHAVYVRRLVREAGHPELGYAALHHDSHETYLGDLPTPLKNVLGEDYERLRETVDGAVAARLGIDPDDFHAPPVAAADLAALYSEASVLKVSRGVGERWHQTEPAAPPPYAFGWSPERARVEFLFAHCEESASRV